MKTSIVLIGFALVLGITHFARAEKFEYNGEDITSLVEYYRAQIQTVETPFVVYSWSTDGGDSYWDHDRTEAEYLSVTQKHAQVFWRDFGIKRPGSFWGGGLYLAVDPAVSYAYGGTDPNSRLLLQLKIPSGFKIVDLVSSKSDRVFPKNLAAITEKLGCKGRGPISTMFPSRLGAKFPMACLQLSRYIFKDILSIDALGYWWSNFLTIPGCVPEKQGQSRAFILTSANRIDAGSVKFFSSRSKENREDRQRIQNIINLAGGKQESFWSDITPEEKSVGALHWLKQNKFFCNGKIPYIGVRN